VCSVIFKIFVKFQFFAKIFSVKKMKTSGPVAKRQKKAAGSPDWARGFVAKYIWISFASLARTVCMYAMARKDVAGTHTSAGHVVFTFQNALRRPSRFKRVFS